MGNFSTFQPRLSQEPRRCLRGTEKKRETPAQNRLVGALLRYHFGKHDCFLLPQAAHHRAGVSLSSSIWVWGTDGSQGCSALGRQFPTGLRHKSHGEKHRQEGKGRSVCSEKCLTPSGQSCPPSQTQKRKLCHELRLWFLFQSAGLEAWGLLPWSPGVVSTRHNK